MKSGGHDSKWHSKPYFWMEASGRGVAAEKGKEGPPCLVAERRRKEPRVQSQRDKRTQGDQGFLEAKQRK